MNMSFKKHMAALLAASLLLCICGCGKKETSSSVSVSSLENSTDSAQTDSVIEAETASDDKTDPQNTENPNGTGTKISAETLTVKKGKANGVDVSKWQGKINWISVKKSGIDFAIIRIGYRGENGTVYKDPNADYNIQQAQKAGILVGVYFFSTAVNTEEAKQEADWTADAIKSYSVSYPVVYDCEGFLNSDSRMYSLTNSARTDNALAFLSRITSHGYEGMFYASKKQLEGSAYWDTERIEAGYKIWVAQYPAVTYPQKENPDYGGKYDMWQYTNMGAVNGITGNADLIVSYFTKAKAAPKSNAAVKTAEAPVEKDAVYTSVSDKVTAKEKVNLRLAAGTGAEIAGMLKNGEVLSRTGIGSNGWSRLIYNGKTVYAITSYLTTDLSYTVTSSNTQASDGFTAVNETVTAKDTVNLREAPTTNSAALGQLKNGEKLLRIGINKTSGWSKLEYNGKTVYAVTSFITTDLSYKAPQSNTSSSASSVTSSTSPTSEADGFQAASGQVTAKSSTNLRTKPTTKEGSDIVYELPNGEYVTRTGINKASGWTRLEYNGQTVYAITSYLTEREAADES